MAQRPKPKQKRTPSVIDPDLIPETLCQGPFQLHHIAGDIAVITFTHTRPQSDPLFETGIAENEFVVRARLAMNNANLRALRDFLNKRVKNVESAAAIPSSGGASATQ